jgi:CHAT domain-containing protein
LIGGMLTHLSGNNAIREWRWLSIAALAAVSAVAFAAQIGEEATTLGAGKSVERELQGGQQHLYTLALAAGEYAGVTVEQRGIDVVVEVRSTDDRVIAQFDSETGKQGREQVGLTADSPVTYHLRVKARYPKDPPAGYEIRVVEVRAATELDRALFEAHKLSTEAATAAGGGKYDDAIKLAERALALGEKAAGPNGVNSDAYVGYLLLSLASDQRSKGDYTNAEQTFQRAIAVSQTALGKDNPQTALALGRLGNLYMERNDYANAERLMQEELDITERTLGPEHPRVADCLRGLSLLHVNRKDMERALPELQRALAIAEKTLAPDDFALIALLNNLGDLYIFLKDTDRAEPLLERALSMIEQKFGREHPYVGNPLQNLAIIARQRRQYERALELFWRAEAVREKALGNRHPQTAALLINIANVYGSEGQYAKALELHQRALDVLETAAGPNHSLTLIALGNIARTYAAQGDIAHATEYQTRYDATLEKNIELNLDLGSEREKLAYVRSTSEHTDRTLSLCIEQAPDNQAACDLAAVVVLQRKGRVLDAMSGSLSALRQRLNAEDRKLLDDLGGINAKLAALSLNGPGKTPADEHRKQLAALQEEKEKVEEAISGRSAEFRAQSQAVTLAAVRAAIPPEAALIEFAVYRPFDPKGENEMQAYGETRYAAYVLRSDGEAQWKEAHWKDLGPAAEIDAAVTASLRALRDPRADVRQPARALYEKAMRPLLALTGNATQLLISPDGALNLVPMEALIDAQGRYLIERYSISYLSSGRDLLRMQVARQSKSGPLVVADPFFGEPVLAQVATADRAQARSPARSPGGARRSVTTGKDLSSVYFAPLSGTAQEALAIKIRFPEATVLTARQATKAALKQADAPLILHIATHGFFLRDEAAGEAPPAADASTSGTRAIHASVKIENPLLRSGLALAGANLTKAGDDDGILTALEASGLNLWGTKLVTLSACDTGVGEVKNGEGVYGLRRAFVLAGAETLVMTLWPVSDYVTREVMTTYYTGLKQGLGRRDALRQAQLAMLKRQGRGHPFYWASFIQSGDWKNLAGK